MFYPQSIGLASNLNVYFLNSRQLCTISEDFLFVHWSVSLVSPVKECFITWAFKSHIEKQNGQEISSPKSILVKMVV